MGMSQLCSLVMIMLTLVRFRYVQLWYLAVNSSYHRRSWGFALKKTNLLLRFTDNTWSLAHSVGPKDLKMLLFGLVLMATTTVGAFSVVEKIPQKVSTMCSFTPETFIKPWTLSSLSYSFLHFCLASFVNLH